MVMDVYDMSHTSCYDMILNVYCNDKNIDSVINDFAEKYKLIKDVSDFDTLCSEIKSTIAELRNGLKILENRYITNIGSRLFYYAEEYACKSILIQVWRGRRPIVSNENLT